VTGVDGSNTYIAPTTFTGTPVNNLNELLNAAVAAGAYDGNPGTTANEAYRDDTATFDEVTGRFVIDWAPDLEFTDATLLYASYSTGYKSGGFNPPVDANLFGSTPATFRQREHRRLRDRHQEHLRERPRAGQRQRVLLRLRRSADRQDRQPDVAEREHGRRDLGHGG
jgi:hypothetical protein